MVPTLNMNSYCRKILPLNILLGQNVIQTITGLVIMNVYELFEINLIRFYCCKKIINT